MEFDFTLTGTTSMLMSNDDVDAADVLTAWQKNPDNKKMSVPGDDRSPPWTWMGRTHHDGKHLAIPQAVIMAILREAGKKMTLKGQTTFKGESQSALFIPHEYCALLVGKKQVKWSDILAIRDQTFAEQAQSVQKMGFVLMSKRAAVNNKKHLRVRARFDDWTVKGRIEIVEPTISEEILNTLFRIGGSKCGMLDWRPNAKSPGTHGQFTAKLVRAD